MIPLLCAAALIDTVCVLDEYHDVVVHEWGVITVSDEMLVEGITSQSIDPLLYDIPYMDDRAPVVYFYGSDFSEAEFTVTLPSGTFTSILPLPDETCPESGSITWKIRSAQNLGLWEIPPEDLPTADPSSVWAMDEWRNGNAHVLEFENGTKDRFLFYECSIPLSEAIYPITQTGDLDATFNGEVLVFMQSVEPTGIMEMVVCSTEDFGSESLETEPYSFNGVLSILCSWSNAEMKSEELVDLWSTWEDYVLTEIIQGGQLLVFRIPPSSVEMISTLNLEAPGIFDVSINRFYLGMVPAVSK